MIRRRLCTWMSLTRSWSSLCFLGRGKRLDPYRAKPYLNVIDCLGGAAVQPCRRRAARRDRPSVVDAPAEEPKANDAAGETDTPGDLDESFYIGEATFGPK